MAIDCTRQWGINDISASGTHPLWCVQSPAGQRAACTLIVGPDVRLQFEIEGELDREQIYARRADAMLGSAEALHTLLALGWSSCCAAPAPSGSTGEQSHVLSLQGVRKTRPLG